MLKYLLHANGDIVSYQSHNHFGHVITDFDRKKCRKFQLSYSKYRFISSAAIKLLKNAKNKVIFLTFSFTDKLNLSDKQANEIWNIFVKNFRKTYKLNHYVGTLEHQKSGNPHYHFLCDYPYFDIREINKSFDNSIVNYCNKHGIDIGGIRFFGNVSIPKNSPSIVNDTKGVIRYICKYISKSFQSTYGTKCYFISRDLRRITKPLELSEHEFGIICDNINLIKENRFDHSTVYCFNSEDIETIFKTLILK